MKIENKNILFFFFTFTFYLYTFSACNPTEPNNSQNISLSVEDASCTEAWLKLETQNINLPVSVSLLQNSIVGQTFSLSKSDTIIYVDSLLPNKTYTFQISGIGGLVSGILSNKVTVTTLDTTSHNFTWQTFTFGGEAGSSALYDVAIVNDTLAFAVGEIYLKDSTGQPDPAPYNLARWNGKKWELKQVPFLFEGQNFYGPIYSIFVFNENDIWLGIGSVIHWDGDGFNSIKIPDDIFPSRINAIWGISDNDLYIVGNGGNIARFQNGQWSKIESGTDLQFIDIFGADDFEGRKQILAVCTRNNPPANGIFKFQGNTAEEISSNIPGNQLTELFGVWFKPNRHYYIVGDGIYEKRLLSDSAWENGPLDITNYATTKISGNALNDIFVVGAFGEFLHFNGQRWQSFRNSTALSNGSYTSVALINNLVVASGYNNASAVITIGKE